MKEWRDEAVIIRLGRFREADIWLRMLLRAGGLRTVFAFGGCRSRRRFCGCLDLLNTLAGRFRLSRRQDCVNLEEATLLRGPAGMRGSWQVMGAAANCLLFVEACGVSAESAPEAFALVEDLRGLLESRPSLSILPLFFRLRLAGAIGQAPGLDRCGLCGGDLGSDARFVVEDGHMICGACYRARHGAWLARSIPVGAAALSCLRLAQQGLPSSWPREVLCAADRQACAAVIDSFVQYHLGLRWDNGAFRRA